ncbi:DUF4326 domain-containing protein [Methylomicrobium sp. Wu6]|uniref:DUF4326 domain-containing protein n=1 Tax=Methylomicrobium sp. Wu6 TaxID=3107928 RepID=UPI002DD66EAC|nr:DUF4326 domain-containing protein [Methylomicrobium sp. Wu6]MEC4749885.1 DUF4326 domain-containing protein [Methylomicrobium sp. Wu6]
MQIFNKKIDRVPADAIYIGRGSHLGNPYAIGESGSRDEVLKAYELYLNKEIDQKNPIILLKLRELSEQSSLACYCRPAPCHGEIIERVWRERIKTMRHQRSVYYAGIGSRNTPEDVRAIMAKLARRLNELGFVLRSGGADGADSAFEDGAKNKQIFLPWEGYNSRDSEFTSPSSEAFRVAEIIHDGWQYLKPGAQKLMARNSHQILGVDMRSPADFVVCWTPDGAEKSNQRSRGTGGTGQAIDLADRFGIPVFNLAKGGATILRIKEWVQCNPLYSQNF